MRDLPVEGVLRDLARRFAEAERRVRDLVAAAPEGDRIELLKEALDVLIAMRTDAHFAAHDVTVVYALSAKALNLLTGLPMTDAKRADVLARSLETRLVRAVATAEVGARHAIGTARPDNLEDSQREAVGARYNRAGQLMPLGAEVLMLTRTIGRHTVSLAGSDMLGEGAAVIIAGGSCPICLPRQGEQPASLRPPFHPHCDCTATPKGYSLAAHVEAMERVTADPAMR